MVDAEPFLDYRVFRWSEEVFRQGSWSQLTIGGSIDDRAALFTPLSPYFMVS